MQWTSVKCIQVLVAQCFGHSLDIDSRGLDIYASAKSLSTLFPSPVVFRNSILLIHGKDTYSQEDITLLHAVFRSNRYLMQFQNLLGKGSTRCTLKEWRMRACSSKQLWQGLYLHPNPHQCHSVCVFISKTQGYKDCTVMLPICQCLPLLSICR